MEKKTEDFDYIEGQRVLDEALDEGVRKAACQVKNGEKSLDDFSGGAQIDLLMELLANPYLGCDEDEGDEW